MTSDLFFKNHPSLNALTRFALLCMWIKQLVVLHSRKTGIYIYIYLQEYYIALGAQQFQLFKLQYVKITVHTVLKEM